MTWRLRDALCRGRAAALASKETRGDEAVGRRVAGRRSRAAEWKSFPAVGRRDGGK